MQPARKDNSMAVDQALLQQLVDEIPFQKADDKTYFLNSLKSDEAAATQFVGQRLRHVDYTKKTTDLAGERQTLAQKANEQVRSYAQELAAAQQKIKDAMLQLETEQISATKARAILARVKSTYNLSDEDIPKIDGDGVVKPTPAAAGLTEAKVQEMMTSFQNDLLKKLAPINSFPMIPVLINEMQAEHQQLTGQRLPEAKIREFMAKSSQENGPSLKQAWEEEFKIADLRKQAERKEWETEYKTKFEDEQKKLASEAALRGVKRGPDGQFKSLSPVIGRKYNEHVDSTNKDMVDNRIAQQAHDQVSGPKPSGAERAAAKWIERREAGIPLGSEQMVGQK